MKRRSNKSTKVPNVKLRPAQGVIPRRLRCDDSILAEESHLGSDDTIAVDLCPRPFRGVVLCATGAFDKPTIFKQAVELGATTTSAFTDRVTHLIAVDHGGAKYQCALERKIPILHPSWITDIHQIWLRGDDVELGDEISKYRLPIFSDVVICPSGIDEIVRRTQINKLVTEHGGVYLKNLERPVRVTHLLCSGDQETDKMKYAKKFNSRGEANVHLVWEEWFWDSLEFGGRFDEEKYQVRRPRPERKSPQEETTPTSPPSTPAAPSDQLEDDQDEPDEELANIKRLPEATLQLWRSLLGRRGYEISDGELIKSPSKVPRPPVLPPLSPLPEKRKGSVISQFRRANSFAPVHLEAASSRHQPFRRTRTTSAMDNGINSGSFMASAPPARESYVNGESSTSIAANTTGIFTGLKFTALGEAKSPSVRAAIEENGGRMLLGLEDEDVDYVIVRLVSGSKFYMQEADETLRGKYRTECWLERCVFQECVCPPEDHITFFPLSISAPVLGADDIRLSFSGLDQAEATWIMRLLRALGIKLEQFFSKKSTHLLCPSGTGLKFDKAREWGTPVVTVQWLARIATTGVIPPISEFLAPVLAQTTGPTRQENVMEIDVDSVDKGKTVDRGKETSPIENPVSETVLTDVSGISNQLAPPSVSPRRTALEVMPVFEPDSILATSTQRNQTTPTHPKVRSEILPFGKPIGLLAGGTSKHPSTPSRTRSTPIVHHTPHHHNSHPKSSAPIALARRPTQREIERERKQAMIPSSRSPSPLKTQCKAQSQPQPPEQIPTDSPARIPRDVAKALEDNITTLLGKRNSVDDEIEPAQKNSRPGKRQRPQRPTRPQSRQPSHAQMQLIEVPIPNYDDSVRPYEPYEDPLDLSAGKAEENRIRVTYEDPKQQAETRRLMSLLNGGGRIESAGSKRLTGTRKSARIVGC
ncbi:S-M checkpoint control protein rad4 [Termitomyces sp. T112]|nr:S-M checkpoint control protein rad4 [Termitomyces sp. T112]